tara:strand:+ start:1783 stop:2502 length:720 start_codon:yes stop_codon:yes gene_type:complete
MKMERIMAEIKRAYSYLRVSGKSQIDKSGFDRQEKSIKAFAKESKFIIDRDFREEGVTGTKGELDRPAFQEMVAANLANGINTVIIESLDRLAREYRIQEEILMYLARHGIDLISANTEENVTQAMLDDPMKKAIIQMQGIFAELDKSLIVKKLKLAREKVKKEKGKCEGAKHYGEVSDDEKAIIKKIVYMRRLSRGQIKRLSYQRVANKLNAAGIKTKRNKKWTGMGVYNIVNKKWIV